MSPRQTDPELGAKFIAAAARLLAERGPLALSTRQLAAAVGTSTMAVYTCFGGMDDLVRAVVHEGFRSLNDRMDAVDRTDDPVSDVVALGNAYRYNAREHAHQYAAMFGGSSLGGFSLTEEDRQYGRFTLTTLVSAVNRCMDEGRFRAGDAQNVAHQLWIALHGLVTLELGGYLVDPYDGDVCFDAQVLSMMVGAGDDFEEATKSVRRARERAGPDPPI